MHQVRDGARILEFDGVELASSTSKHRNSMRWVEFQLFRTPSGSYVISRVGRSLLYHNSTCDVTYRNSIKADTPKALTASAVPCADCQPNLSNDPMVYPERPRYWALVTDSPEGVVDALYKYDEQDARYMTHVARALIEEAAEKDPKLDRAYRVERIR